MVVSTAEGNMLGAENKPKSGVKFPEKVTHELRQEARIGTGYQTTRLGGEISRGRESWAQEGKPGHSI